MHGQLTCQTCFLALPLMAHWAGARDALFCRSSTVCTLLMALPMHGGRTADRLLEGKWAVLIGGVVMAAGHLLPGCLAGVLALTGFDFHALNPICHELPVGTAASRCPGPGLSFMRIAARVPGWTRNRRRIGWNSGFPGRLSWHGDQPYTIPVHLTPADTPLVATCLRVEAPQRMNSAGRSWCLSTRAAPPGLSWLALLRASGRSQDHCCGHSPIPNMSG